MTSEDDNLEKDVASATATQTPKRHRHHRSRHFISHEGRHIHIASSPQEAETLRKQLESSKDQFDLYLQGSSDHLETLRKTHSHHEQSREALRERHGHIYDEFYRVHSELDWLAAELESVASQGVRLEASFSRYGYSAHLRSLNDSKETSPTQSARSSISEVQRGSDYSSPLKLFRVPVVRQYFHKGLLWRAAEQQEVGSNELFVDLLYVGIIAINGDYASEDPAGLTLLRFIITMTMSYKIWNDMTLMISWFEISDMSLQLSILFILSCLLGFTTNITAAFDETYSQLVGFYITARLFTALYLLYIASVVPMVRGVLLVNNTVVLVCTAVWIGSIFVSWHPQLALIFIALLLDMASHTSHLLFVWFMGKIHHKTRTWAENTFEFWPALNIEHKIERTNAFVSLVFGYSVVALIYQNHSSVGLNAFFGKAILGLMQAFCFNWLYFEIDAANVSIHAIRRHKFSAAVWFNMHLPFIMSFILAGGALARLVLAHDCDDAPLEDLSETYQERSVHEIERGIRWFYCCGLGIALACMGFIALTHIHKETSGLRLSKRGRIAIRFSVAIILICLPLADSLDSTSLIGITTSLVVFVLATELYCASCSHDRLFDSSKCCSYVGGCSKRDLAAIKRKVEGDSDADTLVAARDAGATVAH